MQRNDMTDGTSVFLVILPEVVVAQDIEATIREHRPNAEVILARTPDAAAELLHHRRVDAAFIESDAGAFLNTGLGKQVIAGGGRVIVVGQDSAETSPSDQVFALPFPFTSIDIANFLRPFMPL